MKIRHALTVALGFALAGPVLAQTPAPPNDPAALERIRERVRSDPKGVVTRNLALTDAEAKAFWPAYDKCQAEMEPVRRKLNEALRDIAHAESKLTDANARRIARNVLEADAAEAKARKACAERVFKVLPGLKAARYLQIESKMAALRRFDAALAIPLAE